MKKCIFFLAFLFLAVISSSSAVYAQNYFYYSHGEKIALTPSDQEITLKFKPGVTSSEIQSLMSAESSLQEPSPLGPAACGGFFNYKLKPKTDIKQLVARLKTKTEVDIVNPVFLVGGQTKVQISDRFVVQFSPLVDWTEIGSLNAVHHVEVVDTSTASPNL